MRCISPYSNYSIQVIEGNEQVVVDARGLATNIIHAKPIVAHFQQGGLLDHEIEAALENFSFSGIPEGVNPLTRISAWDSDAEVQRWPEEQRDEIHVRICKRMEVLSKTFPSEFVIVEPPVKERPWPSYDEDTTEDIITFQHRLRIKPETIRLYEVENKNRFEVIHAMLEKEDPEAAAEFLAQEDAELEAATAPSTASVFPEKGITVGA